MSGADLVEAWRQIIRGPTKSWVLFENGTCVILTFVGVDDIGPGAETVAIGLLGRARRAKDAEDLRLLHIEDRRLEVA
jgi:hypothetical protein